MHDTHPLRSRWLPDIAVVVLLLAAALLLSWWAYQPPRTATLPVDTLPVMFPTAGMHEPEGFPDRSERYRWSRGSARLQPPNPGGTVLLRLLLAGGTARTVPVVVRTPEQRLTFVVRPEPRHYAMLLPPHAAGRLTLHIEAPTIREHNRTLGVVVSRMQLAGVRGQQSAPGFVVLALVVASLGGYALLRRSQVPIVYTVAGAAATIVLLQMVALWWQAAAGWRYALFVPLLLLAGGASVAAVVLERRLPPTAPEPHTPPAPPLTGQRVALLLLAGAFLVVRLPWLAAPDPVGDLELAARRMSFLYEHGLQGAYMFGGDYMPLRLYLLTGLAHLVALFGGGFHEPLPPVTLLLVKLPGLFADAATLAILYTWSVRRCPPRRALLIALLYTLAPPVWMNVAWWGQVDALLMLPLVGCVLLLDHAGGRWSWLCWAAALLIKPQAIVFAPLLYACTLRRHGTRGVVQGGALAVLLFIGAVVPLALAAQGPGLLQAYLGSVGRFPKLSAGAYNLWYLVTPGGSGADIGQGIGALSFRTIGMLLVGTVALFVSVVLLRRCHHHSRLLGAAVLALAFFTLPTQIHERYLFLSLAFLALMLPLDTRMVVPYTVLVTTATLNILGDLEGFVPLAYGLIAPSPLPLVCAVVNLGVLVWLLWRLSASGG